MSSAVVLEFRHSLLHGLDEMRHLRVISSARFVIQRKRCGRFIMPYLYGCVIILWLECTQAAWSSSFSSSSLITGYLDSPNSSTKAAHGPLKVFQTAEALTAYRRLPSMVHCSEGPSELLKYLRDTIVSLRQYFALKVLQTTVVFPDKYAVVLPCQSFAQKILCVAEELLGYCRLLILCS